jgi:hypothetical protein
MTSLANASRVRRLRCLSWLLVPLLLTLGTPGSAQVRAWLDRDAIALGETATLNIETTGSVADEPDYSPLLGDFRLSGHTSSRRVELVGGNARTQMLFAVALEPRRAGRFQIPALRVGATRTPPLTLTVGPAAATPRQAGGMVFVEAEADAASPYVQQAVGYTVRLYYATALISGQLDQDPPQGATLQRVGEDLQYQRDIAGRNYTVVERRYLLIPERSGPLTVPGARFRGQGVGGFFDDLFGDGRRDLAARGTPRTLQVRAVPDNAPQPWLPLRGLSLQYLATPQALRAGEAASVTVEARIDGASATQLTELQLPAVDGAQVFADPPQVEESFAQGRPQVRLVRKFSIVPARSGTLRIPGPRMPWWDVQAGAARTASLPDLAVEVSAGAANASPAPATAARDAAAEPLQRWIRVPFVQGAVHAWALATVLFALLWLGTLWWALHRRPAAAPVVPEAAARDASANRTADLKAALRQGDLSAIADALRAARSPPLADLDAVCAALDDMEQVAAVRALQQARWGQGDADAARSALRTAFKPGPRWRAAAAARKPLLPPLYPT